MGPNIDPNILRRFILDGLDCDLAIYWSQDASKTVPRGLLGGLGPSWGHLGGGLGRSWGLLALFVRSWGSFWIFGGSFWCRFGVRFVDSIHRFDSMLRFVVSIR